MGLFITFYVIDSAICNSVMQRELAVAFHGNRGSANAQELFRTAELTYLVLYT